MTYSFVYLNFNSGVDVSSLFLSAPEDVSQVAQKLVTSGAALKEQALSRLREMMEAAGDPEDTIDEQLRRQRG